jgi:DNA-directed RNA polymerase specialized sigma24 family protein
MAVPLTKTTRDGDLYVRPQHIEDAIALAQTQDLATLIQRAAITSRSSAEFLHLECLVHLIRSALRTGDHERVNSLLPWLLKRCEVILKKKIPAEQVPSADDLREEIIGDLAVLFAEDSCDPKQRLDFFECRFNLAFRTFRAPYIRRARAEKEARLVQHSDGDAPDERTQDEFLSELAEKFRRLDGIDPALKEKLKAAIDDLPLDQRKAMTLVYLLGLPAESDDPSTVTAATRCGVSGRAIRYRLAKAIARLSQQFKSDDKGRSDHDNV